MQATQAHQPFSTQTILLIPVMALVFAAGAVLGAAADVDINAVSDQVSIPAGDRSYDAVEETRVNRGLSIPAGDRSYDAVEETRADRGID